MSTASVDLKKYFEPKLNWLSTPLRNLVLENIIVVIGAMCIVTLWFSTFILYFTCLTSEERGQFGDMFGAVNSIFSGLAFLGIIYSLLLQREDLGLQREELQKTREEFAQQNKTMALQRFENTFFQLINLRNEIIAHIQTSKNDANGLPLIVTGRNALWEFSKRLSNDFDVNFRKRAVDTGKGLEYIDRTFTNEAEKLRDWQSGYNIHYLQHFENSIGHFFKATFQIYFFIEESELTETEKVFYSNLITTQLTKVELIHLFYFLFNDSNEQKKLKHIYRKYRLFDNFILGLIAYRIEDIDIYNQILNH